MIAAILVLGAVLVIQAATMLLLSRQTTGYIDTLFENFTAVQKQVDAVTSETQEALISALYRLHDELGDQQRRHQDETKRLINAIMAEKTNGPAHNFGLLERPPEPDPLLQSMMPDPGLLSDELPLEGGGF